MELYLALCHDFLSDAVNALFEEIHFLPADGERDFYFRECSEAFFGQSGGGVHNGPDLHLVYFGVRNAQTAAAMSQHGVEFVQVTDFFEEQFFLRQCLRVITEGAQPCRFH